MKYLVYHTLPSGARRYLTSDSRFGFSDVGESRKNEAQRFGKSGAIEKARTLSLSEETGLNWNVEAVEK